MNRCVDNFVANFLLHFELVFKFDGFKCKEEEMYFSRRMNVPGI